MDELVIRRNNCEGIRRWSDLPFKLLRKFAKFLKNNSEDLRNFEAVCKRWRYSTTIPALLPQYSEDDETLFTSSVLLLHFPGSMSSPWMVSVVELDNGIKHLCHPVFGYTFSNLAKDFDIDQFQPSRLDIQYHVNIFKDTEDLSTIRIWHCFDKVLLSSTQPVPKIEDCLLTVILHGGKLIADDMELEYEEQEDDMSSSSTIHEDTDNFDDMISFSGMTYVLNEQGILYELSIDNYLAPRIMVDRPIVNDGANKEWRKRLVRSSSTGKLYLIRRNYEVFEVYELSKHSGFWTWVEASDFGDDQVLFVTRLYSFFVSAKKFGDCNLRNCIVYSFDAFPPYSKKGFWEVPDEQSKDDEIRIFELGGQSSQSIYTYPDFPTMLWSPPIWISQPHRRPIKEEQAQGDNTNIQDSESIQNQGEVETFRKEDKYPEKRVTDATLNHAITSAKILFQGVKIRSDLLPTLERIWAKPGTPIDEDTIRNKDMLACALETLAKVTMTLESATETTLTVPQVDELSSTVSDLQRLGLKVDWLVPVIEKLQKRNSLTEALVGLKAEKDDIVERERKFLAHITKMKLDLDERARRFLANSTWMKEHIEERKASLLARYPSEPINLSTCLWE